MMEILRGKMQTPEAGEGAGQIFQKSNTTSGEGLGASGRLRIDPGVETLEGGASGEIHLDPTSLTEEPQVVVTSSDNKILAEEGPARGSSTIQEAFEQEESCRDLQEQSIACAEIQSLLRTPTISAVTSELSGEANRAKYRFAAFDFRTPPYKRSGYSSLEQDVFNKNVLSCEGDQRGEKRKRKPARADMPVYLPGFHFLWWDPGGYDSYILTSRYGRRRRKHIAACADLLFYPPGSQYKLWDSGGYDRIFLCRGGARGRKNVPVCADLSFYPSGPRYKLWDPGGYNSNILDNRVRGGGRRN
jgi:hypothetical protein